MNAKIKLMISGFLVSLNLAGLGIGSYWAYSATLGYESPMITEESLRSPASLPEHLNEGPMVYTMDKFVVNLSGQPRRTIRVQVNLDMLSAQSFEEIMDSENRAKARDSHRRQIRNPHETNRRNRGHT